MAATAYNLRMGKRIVLLQALVALPKVLESMLKQADEQGVWQRPYPDQWSTAEVLNHLLDVEIQYLQRLQRVVGEKRPYLPAIHPDEKIQIPALSVHQLAAAFAQARVETAAFLQGLTLADWEKTAVHETWGEINLHMLVQRLIDHDNEHLSQMKAITDFRKERIRR